MNKRKFFEEVYGAVRKSSGGPLRVPFHSSWTVYWDNCEEPQAGQPFWVVLRDFERREVWLSDKPEEAGDLPDGLWAPT